MCYDVANGYTVYLQIEVICLLHTCCFIGHRTLLVTEELCARLTAYIEELIEKYQVDTFLFGSKSRFDALCYTLVTSLKEKYPHIKRIYVRAEFPLIDDGYRKYLLAYYEDTYYPSSVLGSGKAVYIKRNQALIDRSNFCIFYCLNDYTPKGRKSGTKIALDYATKHNKSIYTFPLPVRK